MYLITGAGGGIGSVSRRVVQLLLDGGAQVRAMVRRDDDRADQLRAMGADVIVGDLTSAGDIVDAMDGARRMFFNMSVSPDYLRATAEVCAVALERGHLDVIVNMSQMTVSQMTLTSTERVQAAPAALAGRARAELVRAAGNPRQANGFPGQSIVHLPGDSRPSASVACWCCPSAPAARRRSPQTTSRAWWPRCCANPPVGSARCTN